MNFNGPQALSDRATFAKTSICRALAGPDGILEDVARHRFPGELSRIKADISAVGADDVNATTAASAEVQNLVVKKSALGAMLNDIWRVNFSEAFNAAAVGLGTAWRSESNPIPVSRGTLAKSSLPRRTIAGLVVYSNEALEAANAAEHFQRVLEESCARDIDAAFLTTAGGVSDTPAGVFAGCTELVATASPLDDFKNLLQNFNGNLRSTHIVMSSERAARLAMQDSTSFQDVGATGGRIAGLNVVTSQNMPTDSAGDIVGLIDASRIVAAWNGVIVERSNDADIEMIDDFDSNAGLEFVNLFQTSGVAMKVMQQVNWKLLDPSCARVLTGADW